MRGFGAFELIMRIGLRSANYVRSGVALSAVTSVYHHRLDHRESGGEHGDHWIVYHPTDEGNGDERRDGGSDRICRLDWWTDHAADYGRSGVRDGIVARDYVRRSPRRRHHPAIIFYGSVTIAVHYKGIGQLRGKDTKINVESQFEERMTQTEFIIQCLRFGIPFILLIYILGVLQYTVLTAALYTIIAMFITGFSFPLIRTAVEGESLPAEFVNLLGDAADGFREGVMILAPIAIIIAAINGVVDVFTASGIPGILSLALLDLSGGVMFTAVVLAMAISIILGMGMPTVAAYVIVAALIAPALVQQFFVPDLAAHFFVLYAAILSGLTPPIAIAVVVATGIAESNFWRTAHEALKISAPIYVLPFSFIYNPELVVGGFGLVTLLSGALALLGALGISHGLNYYGKFFHESPFIKFPIKGICFGLGLIAMVYPDTMIRGISVAVILVMIGIQLQKPIRERVTARTSGLASGR